MASYEPTPDVEFRHELKQFIGDARWSEVTSRERAEIMVAEGLQLLDLGAEFGDKEEEVEQRFAAVLKDLRPPRRPSKRSNPG